MKPFRFLPALAAAALLSGCVSFGEDPPESLLTLTPTAMATSGVGATGTPDSAIALVEFGAPQRLDVTRVPVQVTDSTVAYVQDAVWVEKPARLFRRLIAETIRVRSGRLVIDGDDPGVMAATRLHGTLRDFGYDARTGDVVVAIDMARSGESAQVTTRRFEARVPGVLPEAGPVGVALNQAANEVAGEIAAWAAG
ncbi:ABC-type transport auxiliary lipoprotein family protein [Qipengyuania sp. MTN3-11]|uniref:ABC-type transport auxiliary lipoprotein family protein n=1 Tax=Qipengyuania sp. MTN3-11 TaxID=3056557 RepID=UPI0036F40368